MQSLKHKLPLFISFEGGDGAGKTTLIEGINAHLLSLDFEVIVTREPGGSHLGEAVRKLLLKSDSGVKIGSKAELMLFLAARAQHVDEVIRPALSEDKIILCDRFVDSSVAYQGFARHLGMEEVKILSDYATDGIAPHLTFYLDIDPEKGLQRIMHARSGDKIESQAIQFHLLVRDAFLQIAQEEPDRVKILDATKPKEEVLKDALSYLF